MLNRGMKPNEVANIMNMHRSTVFRIKSRFNDTGTVARKEGSGKTRSKRTPQLVRAVQSRIRRNPVRSMRMMGKELNVNEKTIRNVVKYDLGARSLARTPRSLLTQQQTASRLERCKRILSFLKSGTHILLFSDEKIFTVDRASNRRNDRIIVKGDPNKLPDYVRHTFRTKHPSQVMVYGLVASDGKKMPLVFMESGEKLNAKWYIELLKQHVKPWVEVNYGPDANYVFTQDGAPCHTANVTQDWLSSHLKNFWAKDMWPPNSPDINPLDFSIRANLQAEACSKPHPNLQSLKTSIINAWDKIDSSYIIKTCRSFRTRIERIIKEEGAIFE